MNMIRTLLVVIAVLLAMNLVVAVSRPAVAVGQQKYKVVNLDHAYAQAGISTRTDVYYDQSQTEALNYYAAQGWRFIGTSDAYGKDYIIFER